MTKSKPRAVIELTPEQDAALIHEAHAIGLTRNRYILMRALEAAATARAARSAV